MFPKSKKNQFLGQNIIQTPFSSPPSSFIIVSCVNLPDVDWIVSHYRWFLDRVCTHILAFEGDSQARLFLGKWSDYEVEYKERDSISAEVTQRIKYRTLKR